MKRKGIDGLNKWLLLVRRLLHWKNLMVIVCRFDSNGSQDHFDDVDKDSRKSRLLIERWLNLRHFTSIWNDEEVCEAYQEKFWWSLVDDNGRSRIKCISIRISCHLSPLAKQSYFSPWEFPSNLASPLHSPLADPIETNPSFDSVQIVYPIVPLIDRKH